MMKHARATSASALVLSSVLLLGLSVRAFHSSGATFPQDTSKPLISQPDSLTALNVSATPVPIDAPYWDDPSWLAPTVHYDKSSRVYCVRVIDSVTKKPISQAKVWLEIGNPPRGRNGYTDVRGAFSFQFSAATNRPKMHIMVESPGYETQENSSELIKEQIIQLTKAT